MVKTAKTAVIIGVILFSFFPPLVGAHGFSVGAGPSSPRSSTNLVNSELASLAGSSFNYTEETLLLDNDTLLKGNVVPAAFPKLSPFSIAYDPSNNDLYVSDLGAKMISVISASDNRIIANISIPGEKGSTGSGGEIVYDPFNDDLYLANMYSSYVTVISGSTNKIVSNISVGGESDGIAYDSSNHDVYVVVAHRAVSVISSSTNAVIATIPMALYPVAIAYDPSNNDLYVANFYVLDPASSGVSVISGSTNRVIENLSVCRGATAIAYDPSDGDLFVAHGKVSVISSSTNAIVANISVGASPSGFAYDPSNGAMYVTNWGSDSVTIISPTGIKSVPGSIASSGLSEGIDLMVSAAVVLIIILLAALVLRKRGGKKKTL